MEQCNSVRLNVLYWYKVREPAINALRQDSTCHVGILAYFQAAQMRERSASCGEHRSINICCAISRLSSAINRLLVIASFTNLHVYNAAATDPIHYTHATYMYVRPSLQCQYYQPWIKDVFSRKKMFIF